MSELAAWITAEVERSFLEHLDRQLKSYLHPFEIQFFPIVKKGKSVVEHIERPAEVDEQGERLRKAFQAVNKDWKEARGKVAEKAFTVPCPSCSGTIHYRVAGPRQHIHMHCDGPCHLVVMQ